MKLRTILMLCMCAMVMLNPLVSEAQIWKNLGKKVEQKVEQQASRRLEKKIDQTIDKGFDEAEGAMDEAVKGKDDKGNATASSSSNKGQAKPEKTQSIRSQYTFANGIAYETTVGTEGKKQNNMAMTMWFSNGGYTGMETDQGGQKTMMVLEKDQMIMFMEAQKSYMVVSSKMMGNIGGAAAKNAKQSKSDKEAKMTKLPNEKVLGYNCEVYLFTSEDGKSKVWVTNDLGFNMADNLFESFKSFNTNQGMNTDYMKNIKGVMLKMEVDVPEEKSNMTMVAKEVYKTPKNLDVSQYKNMAAF